MQKAEVDGVESRLKQTEGKEEEEETGRVGG